MLPFWIREYIQVSLPKRLFLSGLTNFFKQLNFSFSLTITWFFKCKIVCYNSTIHLFPLYIVVCVSIFFVTEKTKKQQQIFIFPPHLDIGWKAGFKYGWVKRTTIPVRLQVSRYIGGQPLQLYVRFADQTTYPVENSKLFPWHHK